MYLFLGAGDEVLYVGTAADLRRRLRQHAAAGPPTSRLHGRYERVRRVVWETAGTPAAAEWREADLIDALRPPYNADPRLRSAPAAFEAPVAEALRPGLHRLLSGAGPRVVSALRAGARAARPAFMQPALDRDEEAALGFLLAGPRRLRDLRRRHGHRAAVVDAGTYRALLVADVEAAVGPIGVGPLNPGGSGA